MTKTQLPETRKGYSHKISIGQQKGRIIINTEGEEERVIEIFLEIGKWGTALRGMCEALSFSINMYLRAGGKIEDFFDKWETMSFMPSGKTSNPEIPRAESIMDYLCKYIKTAKANSGFGKHADKTIVMENLTEEQFALKQQEYQACSLKGS